MEDLLRLEVTDIEVQVLTGIYSEEAHLPQPLRVDVRADLDCPARFMPDTPLSASKNYLDLKRAATEALPEGQHFTLVEAVADHICDTLFRGDPRVRRRGGEDREARHFGKGRIDRHHHGAQPDMKARP